MITDQQSSGHAIIEPVTYREKLRFLQWYFWLFFCCVLLLNGLQWAFLYWKIPYTDAVLFLHYTIYFGVDMTGPWWRLLLLPGFGLLLLFLNSIVVLQNYYRRPLIAWIALAVSSVCNILLGVSLYYIIQINL